MTVDGWWDETDVLAFMEVEPELDAEDSSYFYVVDDGSARLELTIAPLDAYVRISCKLPDYTSALVDWEILDCSGIRYVNDQRGEYLLFAPTRAGARLVVPLFTRLTLRPAMTLRWYSTELEAAK